MDARPSLVRRRGRRFLLRSVRFGRRHYGSVFTFMVLSVAAIFVLRSPDFSGRLETESQPTTILEQDANDAEVATTLKQNEVLPDLQIAFYVYSDEAQRQPVEEYLRRHFRYLRSQGYPEGVIEVNFLRVTNEAEEREAIQTISQVAGWVAARDIHLSVIDLR